MNLVTNWLKKFTIYLSIEFFRIIVSLTSETFIFGGQTFNNYEVFKNLYIRKVLEFFSKFRNIPAEKFLISTLICLPMVA